MEPWNLKKRRVLRPQIHSFERHFEAVALLWSSERKATLAFQGVHWALDFRTRSAGGGGAGERGYSGCSFKVS